MFFFVILFSYCKIIHNISIHYSETEITEITLTLYPRMSPLRSVSGTSPHRTRMLLEVVAKADTLVGPLEGTTVRK